MAKGRKSLDKFLAEAEDKDEKGKAKARKSSLAAQMSRLCTNKDFEEWLFRMLEDMCAFGQGIEQWDAFVQGKRAAGEWMIRSLYRGGDDGAQLMTRLYARHFGDLVKKTNQEENT